MLENLASERTALEDDDNTAFERDLEIAKQLSLAEQRVYEHGSVSKLDQ
jgi:hypothetical protein